MEAHSVKQIIWMDLKLHIIILNYTLQMLHIITLNTSFEAAVILMFNKKIPTKRVFYYEKLN